MEPLDPASLKQLAARGQTRDPVEQAVAAKAVNALLLRMRTEGDREANARAIADALASKSLDGLETWGEQSCRAEAVETLIRLGFPTALEISPEDLAHHRKHRTGRGPGWVAIGAVIFACWWSVVAGASTDHDSTPEIFLVLASVIFLIVRWFQRNEWRKHERS